MLFPVVVLVLVQIVAESLAVHKHDVCPQINCPERIPDDCRKPEFVIGSDGRTRCRVCDSNLCGPDWLVCPERLCSTSNIREICRKAEYEIGSDGITKCRVCDTDLCGSRSSVCPPRHCPFQHKIPRRCRVKQRVMGSDGITTCPACFKNRCRGSIGSEAPH